MLGDARPFCSFSLKSMCECGEVVGRCGVWAPILVDSVLLKAVAVQVVVVPR
jgi:hypothetical protein